MQRITHNDIILSLTDEILIDLLLRRFGNQIDTMLSDWRAMQGTCTHGFLNLRTTFEFPIVKGKGQYMCTKGFIDLIVHCCPQINDGDTALNWADSEAEEFIIEVKTVRDFEDFGSILRQIKEYRQFYNSGGVAQFNSKLISSFPRCTYFCVLSTIIPNDIKDLFEKEGIICLELINVSKELKF